MYPPPTVKRKIWVPGIYFSHLCFVVVFFCYFWQFNSLNYPRVWALNTPIYLNAPHQQYLGSPPLAHGSAWGHQSLSQGCHRCTWLWLRLLEGPWRMDLGPMLHLGIQFCLWHQSLLSAGPPRWTPRLLYPLSCLRVLKNPITSTQLWPPRPDPVGLCPPVTYYYMGSDTLALRPEVWKKPGENRSPAENWKISTATW